MAECVDKTTGAKAAVKSATNGKEQKKNEFLPTFLYEASAGCAPTAL
jgi:hypothetical protein